VIVEAFLTMLIDTFSLLGSFLDDLGLSPTWPSWVSGSGSGTIRGAFAWIASGLEPFAAWINLPLLGTVCAFILFIRAGLIAWAVIARGVAAIRGAMP
jgi:hypothetical protein